MVNRPLYVVVGLDVFYFARKDCLVEMEEAVFIVGNESRFGISVPLLWCIDLQPNQICFAKPSPASRDQRRGQPVLGNHWCCVQTCFCS